MPPTLDLSASTYTHAMLLTAQNSPRLSLRRGGLTYNKEDRGPLSSTSSRFSFNHLLTSPPPSPGLPALVPRHGKPLPTHKPRTYFRGFLWLLGVLTILYYGFEMVGKKSNTRTVGWATGSGEEYEMVGDSELPDFPTPVMIVDKRGRSKWTVSIPPYYPFPLEPKQYADICQQNMEVAKHVAELHKHKSMDHAAHHDYYHVDPNFMDVAEAEAHGLLPGPKAKTNRKGGQDGSLIGEDKNELITAAVCERTLTFVLETADAGLGKTLMQLWTAYGLAKKEGREFFIDDSRWAYGKYTNYFKAPRIPHCRPPPRHEMLPCPHHARHLVISAATVSYSFGGAFTEHFEDPKKMEVHRQEPIFALAHLGYKALFTLKPEDEIYVHKRTMELQAKTQMENDMGRGLVIGLHVRHGDRRPYEFQYKDSYIPLDVYLDEAREQMYAAFNTTGPNGTEDMMAEMKSLFVVASDDPDVYSSPEFAHTLPAQEQIRLASKGKAAPPKPSPSPRKFVDEAVGWEGGFFAGMFWSLGETRSSITAVEKQPTKVPPTQEALRLRELVGRAYLMDLAVLGEGSDRIVCTVSSMGCRMLAVMMGWEEAIEKGWWRNIDGDFGWRGVEW